MKDRIVEYPNRFRLVAVEGQAGVYDIEAVPGTVTEVGTAINKATLLSDATAALYGLTGSDATPDKAFGKISAPIGEPIEITTSQTWIVPEGITKIGVFIIGGGGGGAGANTGYASGGGGAGYAQTIFIDVTPGQQIPIVIGAGGAANSDGGNTSILGFIAYGGKKGLTGADHSNGLGGDGSSGGGGGNLNGGNGGNSRICGDGISASAAGGKGCGNKYGVPTICPLNNTIYGGGGAGGPGYGKTNISLGGYPNGGNGGLYGTNGGNASGPGGGGGGVINSTAGGTGGVGLCIIQCYGQ